MKIVKTVAAVGVLCLPLATLSSPVQAASAHNSQAGANGDTSNNAAPTGMHNRAKKMKHMKAM